MICKGDVFLWFNNLNGASRIDVIHGLLNKCVPWELRFLGSCLEDMCKSSYEHLKKWEYIANSATELGKLDSISENPMRSTVIISLALLHSSNRTCANITFNLLATQINVLLSLMANPSVADEIALLFTLALRHPAFTFEQKRTLEMHLKAMEETYGQNILNILREETKLNSQTSSYEASNGEFIPLLDIVDDNNLTGVLVHDSACETSCATDYSSCPVVTSPSSVSDNVTPISTSSANQPSSANQSTRVNTCSSKSSNVSLTLPKAQIKNLELKGAHKKKKKGDKRVEYRIQVTWSNGDVTEVMKTHQELFNFHQKLVNGEDRQILYFIGPKQAQRGEDFSDDFASKMSDYLRQLMVKVPQHIRDSDAVISFFSFQPMCFELPVTSNNESKVVVSSCDTSSNVCLSPGSPVLHHQNSLSHIQQHASNISSSSSSLSSSSPPPSQPATSSSSSSSSSTAVYNSHRGSNDGITKVTTTTSTVPSKSRVNSSPEPLSPSSNSKQPFCVGLRNLSNCSNSIDEESRVDYALRKENHHDIFRKNRNGYTPCPVENMASKVRSISLSPAAVSPLTSTHNSCCTVQTQVYMPECGSVNDLVHYMAPKINSKLTEAYPVSCTSPVTSCSFSCLNSPEAYIINDGCAKIVDAQFCVDRSSNNSVMISDSSKGHKNPGDDMNTKVIGSDTREMRVLRNSRSNNGNGCSAAQQKGKSLNRQGECRKVFVDSPHASKPSYSIRCDDNNGCESESGTSSLQTGDARPRSHSHCNIPTTAPSGMALHFTEELSTSSSSTTAPMLINQTVSGRQLPYYTVAPQSHSQQQGLSVHLPRLASRTVPSSTAGMCTSCPCSRGSATPPPPPMTQSHPAISHTPFIHLPPPLGVFPAFPPNAAAFMPTQSTSSFVPTPNAIPPPSFPFLHSPDGMTPELAAYPSLNNPFHAPHQQQPPGVPSSQQRVQNAPPGFVAGPTPNVGFHGTQMPPSPIGNMTPCGSNTSVMSPHVAIVAAHVSFNPTLRSQKSTCYNCGVAGHHGLECPETTMEEISKGGHFELSYIRGDKSLDGCE